MSRRPSPPLSARPISWSRTHLEGVARAMRSKWSEKFEGKRLLERHRMVNTALAPHMAEIHAVSIKKALTPAQAQLQPEPATDKSQA
ncbi:hypothetical protein PR202_ga08927 [Eleusine coracana subsp. coracana]|uniref:Uncharacterized protein n=1 Tax=Eleusine coracana subsp. coracana TaxID=191504 RepID=A0AAV5C1U6_ELECO|nr:hypothetical protein PR202_ga08927 [Eleusine coracana subsp. coracana]